MAEASHLHVFLIGACGLCVFWTASSAVVFFRRRDALTVCVVVTNSVAAVVWAVIGAVWLARSATGTSTAPARLRAAATAADVLLFSVGTCSGCCVGLFRVEKFFDDGVGVGYEADVIAGLAYRRTDRANKEEEEAADSGHEVLV